MLASPATEERTKHMALRVQLIGGRRSLNPEHPDAPASMAEITRLMKDPLYSTDEAYRVSVYEAMAKTLAAEISDPSRGIEGRHQAIGKINSAG
jgi:hypothetical protein